MVGWECLALTISCKQKFKLLVEVLAEDATFFGGEAVTLHLAFKGISANANNLAHFLVGQFVKRFLTHKVRKHIITPFCKKLRYARSNRMILALCVFVNRFSGKNLQSAIFFLDNCKFTQYN